MTAGRMLAVLAAGAGCGSAGALPAARFDNAPAALVVDDRREVIKRPEVWTDLQDLDGFDAEIERPIIRPLELPRQRRALGVNAVDEVPDSTWFTNRIGVRDLTADEVRRGPASELGPEQFTPWTVHDTKPGGTDAGLMITDTRGVKYMLKFDSGDRAELESATHVIVNRLLWACGYHVPDDRIVFARLEDLRIAPGAKIKQRNGRVTGTLTQAELEHGLARVAHSSDGRIRVLASRWLDGTSLGGPSREGVRRGDPNDRIPHELRRDLRGEYPILAWLDHVDMTRGNSVDMWVRDAQDPGRHYVEHYQVDFGLALGVMGSKLHDLHYGHTYELDYADVVRTLVTLGLHDGPRGRPEAPRLRGVAAMFVTDGFDPGTWHTDVPYIPFDTADRFDKFWGATVMARFSRDQIRAAVDAGALSDPGAVDYLVDTLVARQQATLRYWFAQVNPVAHATAARDGDGAAVCFDDLAVKAGLVTAAATRYRIATYDPDARRLGPDLEIAAARGGRTCVARPLSTAGDGYTILEIETRRPEVSGRTYVHVARDRETAQPRVIGIWRT